MYVAYASSFGPVVLSWEPIGSLKEKLFFQEKIGPWEKLGRKNLVMQFVYAFKTKRSVTKKCSRVKVCCAAGRKYEIRVL